MGNQVCRAITKGEHHNMMRTFVVFTAWMHQRQVVHQELLPHNLHVDKTRRRCGTAREDRQSSSVGTRSNKTAKAHRPENVNKEATSQPLSQKTSNSESRCE